MLKLVFISQNDAWNSLVDINASQVYLNAASKSGVRQKLWYDIPNNDQIFLYDKNYVWNFFMIKTMSDICIIYVHVKVHSLLVA